MAATVVCGSVERRDSAIVVSDDRAACGTFDPTWWIPVFPEINIDPEVEDRIVEAAKCVGPLAIVCAIDAAVDAIDDALGSDDSDDATVLDGNAGTIDANGVHHPRPSGVVIGETVDRVIAEAQRRGAVDIYRPTIYEEAYAREHEEELIAVNRAWINGVMDAGLVIYDLGLDLTRKRRSPYYRAEIAEIEQRGYTNVVLLGRRHVSVPGGYYDRYVSGNVL